jgi:hypothetical protein
MAVFPAVGLANWFGTDAGTIAASGVAPRAGYYIPATSTVADITDVGKYALVATTVTNDIRDFLFSILSACADRSQAAPPVNDTKRTNMTVIRSTNPATQVATFSVTFKTIVLTPPVATGLGTDA